MKHETQRYGGHGAMRELRGLKQAAHARSEAAGTGGGRRHGRKRELTPVQEKLLSHLSEEKWMADWLLAELVGTTVIAASRSLNILEEKGRARMSFRLGTKYWSLGPSESFKNAQGVPGGA
jgi:hypothetical protein